MDNRIDDRNDPNNAMRTLFVLFGAIVVANTTTGTFNSTSMTLMVATLIGLSLCAILFKPLSAKK